MDARTIGTVALKMQLGECHTSHSQRVSVDVFADHGTFRSLLWHHILSWTMDTYTIPVQKENQLHHTRFCVEQREEVSQDVDVWLLQEVLALSWLPTQPEFFFQARVNLECGEGAEEVAEVDVESSTDGGRRWTSLHRRCLPGGCMGGHSALTSTITRHAVDSWGLVTLPLPYPALTPHTRLRVRQATGHSKEDTVWALDNVFVGRCLRGCSGRGLCQRDGRCKCEYGYSGPACEDFERENPLYLSEPFTNVISDSANILQVSGGRTSYSCGVVGSGTAAVFRGAGPRALTTVDVNTTHAHFLQFHYVGGTVSDVGKCPGPDDPAESVYVHYSCDGGVSWHLLRTLHASLHKEPSHISLDLPPGARGPGCRFQIWQETHSGAGRDIWAVDDFTITSQLFNNIEVDFSDGAAANSSLRFHLGELGGGLCGRDSALVFKGVSAGVGVSRFMETKSIGVGPSYMMQFDLAIGCGDGMGAGPERKGEGQASGAEESKLLLEYSSTTASPGSSSSAPARPRRPAASTTSRAAPSTSPPSSAAGGGSRSGSRGTPGPRRPACACDRTWRATWARPGRSTTCTSGGSALDSARGTAAARRWGAAATPPTTATSASRCTNYTAISTPPLTARTTSGTSTCASSGETWQRRTRDVATSWREKICISERWAFVSWRRTT
nr:reelin-like [Penaeus vannamei]